MFAAKNSLACSLKQDIISHGPLPFVDYMRRCLTAYYGHLETIGAAGDFVTAPELGPYFAVGLSHAIVPHLQQHPVIIEWGAGTGQLAFDLLLALDRAGVVPQAYVIQEWSPSLRAVQIQRLQALPAQLYQRVSWECPDAVDGILLANEVFDALPVERFVQMNHVKKRLGVGWQENQFTEVVLDQEVNFCPPGIDFASGYRSEFCPDLDLLLDQMLRPFKRGIALIIDYGYEREDYYAPYRSNGTLQAYFQHQEISPFLKPGEVDLTAHVDFTALAEAMMARGWQIDFLKPQNRFLLEHHMMSHYSLTPEHYALNRLLDPRLMGEVFKVMGASKRP